SNITISSFRLFNLLEISLWIILGDSLRIMYWYTCERLKRDEILFREVAHLYIEISGYLLFIKLIVQMHTIKQAATTWEKIENTKKTLSISCNQNYLPSLIIHYRMQLHADTLLQLRFVFSFGMFIMFLLSP
ncbi:hypothetical protein ACJX0J_019304, partial [Zea mays]